MGEPGDRAAVQEWRCTHRRNRQFSKRPHSGNHTFVLGNINTYTFKFISPIQNLQPEPIFSRCRFNLLSDTNSRLNLLKPNVATRGWLTVLISDFMPKETLTVSCAPYCSFGTRRTPPAGCREFQPNYIVIGGIKWNSKKMCIDLWNCLGQTWRESCGAQEEKSAKKWQCNLELP